MSFLWWSPKKLFPILYTVLFQDCRLFVQSLRTDPLLTLSEPCRMRSYLEYESQKSSTILSYAQAKDILHTKLRKIDIYGDGDDKQESLNVEHIFPQSFFKNDTRKLAMKSDLHHLYLCNRKLNSFRQNFKYVDSSVAKIDDKIRVLDMKGNAVNNENELFAKRGYLMVTNKNSKTFVPAECSRGKVARALSYFAVKYDYLDTLEKVIDIRTLVEWSLKDPVDNDEYLKNVIIYKHQGDINPFVFNPDLVLYSFTDRCTIDDELLRKKRLSVVDPFYSIDYLLNDIRILEEEKKALKLSLGHLLKKKQ